MILDTIAIIGAMEAEINLLKNRLENGKSENIAGVIIYQGTLAGKSILLAQSGIGKVNASITTSLLLDKYQADCVINTGSAGGLQKGMKQGDVVIGTQSAHHDVDASAFGYAIGQVPQLPPRFHSDTSLISHATHAAKTFDKATIHQGLIVSGDQFINHPDKIARIRNHFPDALAVEMEAAAIAQTCHQFSRPYVIIRALSDLADGDAELSFDAFLPIAATHSAEMVQHIISAL